MKYFPVKSRHGRDAGQREQEDQHQDGFGGGTEVESGDIVHFVADYVALAQGRDYGECSQVHEGVHQQIDQNALEAVKKAGAGYVTEASATRPSSM